MGKTIRNNMVAKHSEKYNKPKTVRDKKKDFYITGRMRSLLSIKMIRQGVKKMVGHMRTKHGL